MLAIAARAPIQLKEAISGERSFRGALLEIAKVSIVAGGALLLGMLIFRR
jgi:hypothetical protein